MTDKNFDLHIQINGWDCIWRLNKGLLKKAGLPVEIPADLDNALQDLSREYQRKLVSEYFLPFHDRIADWMQTIYKSWYCFCYWHEIPTSRMPELAEDMRSFQKEYKFLAVMCFSYYVVDSLGLWQRFPKYRKMIDAGLPRPEEIRARYSFSWEYFTLYAVPEEYRCDPEKARLAPLTCKVWQ